jgi:uncharacterized membrane protein YoaK (UPF0700 family)
MDVPLLPPGGEPAPYGSLLVLTFVTGIVDAVSFLGLGHIFTANMTGNVVFLGFAIGGGAGVSALRSLLALGAFACGGFAGGRLVNRRNGPPTHSLLIAMRTEGFLLAVAAASSAGVGSLPPVLVLYTVIVSTGIAMGVRNAAVRALDVPDLTTTVLTLTITGLAADSRLAGGKGIRSGRRAVSAGTMCAGAMGGSLLLGVSGLAAALGVAAVLVFCACPGAANFRARGG